MTARTLNNVVNDQTVALNALIYGYAGHSLVTPQYALQQIWWTEERINEKVNQEFVNSRLQPKEREWLNRPVGFGDLTDDTYMEWILEKARRLFLILVEIGEADRIFAVVERSWDDDDLPLSIEDIEQLSLANRRDDQASLRFYQTQFSFLLRVLGKGLHVDYASNEHIPLEYVMGLPPAVSLQHWSRVHLPKKPHEVYVRRKFPLGTPELPVEFEEEYIMDVESAQMVEHDHIAPVWASYTAKDWGYILTNFVGQHTLKTFIDHRNPTQYQRLEKADRRQLVLNWMLCLSDAIATLHRNGFCHSAIRPSNILINEANEIAFSEIASLATFQKDKKPDPMDAYIYAAPEHQIANHILDADMPILSPGIGTQRKPSTASKSSSGSSHSSGSRHKLMKAPTNDFSGFNFGFKKNKQPIRQRSRAQETEQADIYSLGCVFVEIITFMLKKKPHDFLKHRSSKQKVNMGGKNSRTDSSYHANLEKIETWITMLENAAPAFDDEAFLAVPPILSIVRTMLSRNPNTRPTAREVRSKLFEILYNNPAMTNMHCGTHKEELAPATSTTSGSDRASSISSYRTSSISSSSSSSVSSDADTIRLSTTSTMRVASILNSYSDRSTLAGISEDEDDEPEWLSPSKRPVPPPVDKSYESSIMSAEQPTPPLSPLSPRSAFPPLSPRSVLSPMADEIERAHSPSNATAKYSKSRSWKPRLRLP